MVLDGPRRVQGRDDCLGAQRLLVVEIDPETRRLLLHDPGSWQYTGGGDTLPLEVIEDCEVCCRPARLRVTGDGEDVRVDASAAD